MTEFYISTRDIFGLDLLSRQTAIGGEFNLPQIPNRHRRSVNKK